MSESSDFHDKDQIKRVILAVPSSTDSITQHQGRGREAKEEDNKEEETVSDRTADDLHETTPLQLPFAGELNASDVDDEDTNVGFRTPTSLDHKIPEIRPCPLPPRKLKPNPSGKRKSSDPDDVCRVSSSNNSLIDLSREVESMFPPLIQANIGRKIKKARSC
ncbi:hypothetical protein Nepgr_031921 [Nepenthes gracilis]|uniref:Cyclin-dependent protein kinase inhibitor SMR3-like n=1 Tax=Nepenthes gracilis TaxID=150966 RepID=A0AAD3THM7_NEPGR|nr:hypothetical protein Nepgr_031921 [Nepenthes gracilis]